MSKPTSLRPVALPLQPAKIPQLLKDRPQWVTWRYVWHKGKWDKPPRNPWTDALAKTTDSRTWSPFDAAFTTYQHSMSVRLVTVHADGIGFVVTEDNELAGIDLDHCRDPDTGVIESWAQAIVDRMRTYTEVSPSGTGLRLWLTATRPKRGRRKGLIEIYSWGRYLTCTGCHLDGTPTTIESRQVELEAFEAELTPTPQAKTARPTPAPDNGTGPDLSDDALIDKALGARNAGKFARLWSGGYRRLWR